MLTWELQNPRFNVSWFKLKPGMKYRPVRSWRWDRIALWVALLTMLSVGIWKS